MPDKARPTGATQDVYEVDPGLADTLDLLVEHRLEAKVQEWRDQLAARQLTAETRAVFYTIGWLPNLEDRRIRKVQVPAAKDSKHPEDQAIEAGNGLDDAALNQPRR